MNEDGEKVIIQIQQEIEQQRKIGGFWEGYCNLQKLASGDIWESSTRYIYELLQNAEDAKASEFKIYISKERIKIVHNGKPFTKDDVRNICYAVSKKDPNETIGYLGVGFRSVFIVTDKPEIYSGEYRFRFDREECIRKFGDSSLFYFYPFWIEQPTEHIDLNKTTFILPFKSEDYFDKSMKQLKKLGVHSLLFLRNIKNISIYNEVDNTRQEFNITLSGDLKPLPNYKKILEEIKDNDIKEIKMGKFLLIEGDKVSRFLVFRGTFKVPDDVRNDEETKRAKREKIKTREISVAFKLDKDNNLKPTKGYICSFFPIQERKINFLVHADFIVQAGRVALLENKWNRWMIEKARKLAEAGYHYFQENPEENKWIEQFLIIFEERKDISEKYDDIFEKPLFNATKNPMVICIENKRIPLENAVKITEETEELVKRGFIKCSDLKIIYNKDSHLIRKDYPTGGRKVDELKVDDINNENFIKMKIEEGKGIEFLTLLYSVYKKAIERKRSRDPQELRELFIKIDLGKLLVIDRNGNVKAQNEVYIEPDLKIFDELKEKGINVDKEQILSEFNLINKELWDKAKDYLPEVKKITKDMILEKCVLPRIKTSSERPSKDDLLSWTYLLKCYVRNPKEEIWVIDNKGQIRKSSEVFLSDKYDPTYRLQKYNLPNINFISEEYLELDDDSQGWKNFFQNTLMKGYNKSDYEDYIRNTILPILTNKEKIKNLDNLKIINYTRVMVECGFEPGEPIFVVLKNGEIEKSDSEIYFPVEYSPKQNWEGQSIIRLKFVSPEYIGENDVNTWKEFFKKIGVKEEASQEMIEEVGKALVRKKFESEGYKVEPYGGVADLKATKENKTYFIEVKSKSSGEVDDQRLDSKKAKFAQEKKDNFYLAKVINIPNAPVIYLLKNPVGYEGITFEMNIPKHVIEKYAEKIDVKNLIKCD